MLNETLRIAKLTTDLKSDFYKVHALGEFGNCCYCMAWWMPSWDGWNDRTCEQNREAREELFSRNEFDGYLLYVGDEPQGWCQVGSRDRFSNLLRVYRLDPDPTMWSITCFLLNPAFKGKGYAHRFLKLILEALKREGITKVQAFPHLGENLSSEDVWPGPLAIYEKAGFSTVKADARRPIMEYTL